LFSVSRKPHRSETPATVKIVFKAF